MKSKIEYVGKCLLITEGKKRILIVGDLHVGYEETLNKSGIMVSRQMFKELTSQLEDIFKRVGGKVDEVVLLGDVKHEFGTILHEEWRDVLALIDFLNERSKKIVITKGNHDTNLEYILKKRKSPKLKLVDRYKLGDFCFLHGDKDYEELWKDKEIKTIVVGHGHPAIRLKEKGEIRTEKYKSFLIGKFKGKQFIIVPSFSEWYAGSDPREGEVILAWDINFDNFDVKLVSEEGDVLDFGKLKKLY